MICDRDTYASNRLLILQHGEHAAIHAAIRADALLEAGDLDGQRVWLRIINAIDDLRGTTKPAHVAVH